VKQRKAFRDARDEIIDGGGAALANPFASAFPVTGAAVSVLSGPAIGLTVSSTDPVADRLDELQFDLGEGPCWSAFHRRSPIVCPDIRAEGALWPAFTAAVVGDPATMKVSAMYAFPLTIGSLDIGALDLYAVDTTPMEAPLVAEAAMLADLAAWQVLRVLLADHDKDYDGGSLGYSRREVHQATGMIIAQLDVSADDAALLLRAHAFSSGRTVREIARDVVDRRLDFATPAGKEVDDDR